MSTINRLSSVDVLQPGDQIPVWDSSNGDTRKASMTTLLAFVESYFADPDYSTRIVAPNTDYFTVDIGNTGDSIWMIVNPILNFTTGAITLPSTAYAVNDQEITVVFTAAVLNFSITSSGATVLGAPATINGYDSFRVRYSASQQTWYTLDTTGDGSGVSQIIRQDFTGDGTTTTFTLTTAPSALGNELQIFIDGVYQQRAGYAVTGSNIVFSEAPPSLSTVEVLGWSVSVGEETSANLVSYTPAGTGAVLTTVQAKLRESVSVLDFGADPTGVSDSSVAIRAAIASVTAAGGSVYIPAGQYKVTAAAGDPSNTAINVPSFVRVHGASQGGTLIVPGADNTVCFRLSGMNGTIESLQIDNIGGLYSNVSGIRVTPIDETQTSYQTDTEFNSVTNVSIRRLAEAITLRCGPSGAWGDSYCYYNTFTNIDIRNCTLGIWLKVPNTVTGSGCNRNTFISVRVGESGTNTGLKIDAGDTCKFIACAFEGIQSGTYPNTTPTAVQIAYNTVTYGCVNNQFHGLVIEACTRDVDNDNDETEFYGWFHTGTYYSPSSRPLAVDIRNDALVMNAPIQGTSLRGNGVGTNRTPTAQGDFYNSTGTTVKSVADVSGAVEFRIDAPGNYGYYTFYQLGAIQWSMGTIGTGAAHIGFFNGAGTNLVTVRSDGEFRPGVDNTNPLGSASFRWSEVFAGTGTINTSDARAKQQDRPLSVKEQAVAVKAKSLLKAFKFNDAVAEKGGAARIHFGVYAQELSDCFASEGLDAAEYAMFCYDEWEDEWMDEEKETTYTDESGKEITTIIATGNKIQTVVAGNRYGVRYDQLFAFILAAI